MLHAGHVHIRWKRDFVSPIALKGETFGPAACRLGSCFLLVGTLPP